MIRRTIAMMAGTTAGFALLAVNRLQRGKKVVVAIPAFRRSIR